MLVRFLRSCGTGCPKNIAINRHRRFDLDGDCVVGIGALASSRGQFLAAIVVAMIAVPLAMPTFFEIPLAVLLLSVGAPAGAAVAIMIAGPSLNLPSLFTIARSTNWKVAGAVAASIFLLAVLAGVFGLG